MDLKQRKESTYFRVMKLFYLQPWNNSIKKFKKAINTITLKILKGIGLDVVFNITNSLVSDVSGARADLTTESAQSTITLLTSNVAERALGQMDNLLDTLQHLLKRIYYKKSIYCALVANLFACSKPYENVIQLKKSISNRAYCGSQGYYRKIDI